ncbi:tyrosine-type recombinase/integrase [Aureispira sp. CCB-QB1]|uniref:tyrosine-type recombinase/integrase n=1 Tax=Aureispira sp. CCB-QB1 TaxID=1313421 RepID=UPI0006973663|nr:tyrosine-type recombinase/integrase [Aureispira sp. CCB-QB1]
MKKLELKTKQYEQLEKSFKSWLEVQNYSESTCYNLPLRIREFLHYQEGKKKDLAAWQGSDFESFMSYYKNRKNQRKAGALSTAHINKTAHALCLLQKYLGKLNQLDFYYKIERLKREEKEIKVFSQEQIKQLYEACDSGAFGYRNKVILGLCYGCGLRKSEAVNLELSDLWYDKALLQVRKSKTKTSRLVPLTAKLIEDFKDYQSLIRPLFLKQEKCSSFLLSNRGTAITRQVIYLSFTKLLEEAEMPKTGLHTLRHSIASHLAQSGMSSEQIGQFLGHKTLDSTQIYVHYKTKEL